jgi:NAD(P)-dependent dehydrogenase (short-subunit alcohol dehydrogenase family)
MSVGSMIPSCILSIYKCSCNHAQFVAYKTHIYWFIITYNFGEDMFENQIVAITGATGGIGRAIAEMFIAQGAKVAISDRSSPDAVAKEIGAQAYGCDVSKDENVIAFIDAVEADLGPIDVFVSNAGVGFGDGPHVAGASNKGWELSWQVNVMSSVYAARCLMPRWLEEKRGRFIITASAAGLLNQVGSASYTATKHAAVAFAESIAIEHAHHGVKAHCICPQYVRTNMTKGMEMAENGQDELLEPVDVSNALLAAMKTDSFLVLPHKVVKKYTMGRAHDHDAWLDGMNKYRQSIKSENIPL